MFPDISRLTFPDVSRAAFTDISRVTFPDISRLEVVIDGLIDGVVIDGVIDGVVIDGVIDGVVIDGVIDDVVIDGGREVSLGVFPDISLVSFPDKSYGSLGHTGETILVFRIKSSLTNSDTRPVYFSF